MARQSGMQNGPGMVRMKLAVLLGHEGFKVNPDDLMSRRVRNFAHDSISWSAEGTDRNGNRVRFESYDTMSRCVNRGIEIRPSAFGVSTHKWVDAR